MSEQPAEKNFSLSSLSPVNEKHHIGLLILLFCQLILLTQFEDTIRYLFGERSQQEIRARKAQEKASRVLQEITQPTSTRSNNTNSGSITSEESGFNFPDEPKNKDFFANGRFILSITLVFLTSLLPTTVLLYPGCYEKYVLHFGKKEKAAKAFATCKATNQLPDSVKKEILYGTPTTPVEKTSII